MTIEEAVAIIEAKKNKVPKAALSAEERKAKQNAYYAEWRQKLNEDPVKLVEYWQRKNEASKKCIAKKKAMKAAEQS